MRNEQRFLTILNGYTRPDWVKGFRKATIEQDIRGVDFFVNIRTSGAIIGVPFQVKSSERAITAAAKKFQEKGFANLVEFIVVNEYRTDHEILQDVGSRLEAVRKEPKSYNALYSSLNAPLRSLEEAMRNSILQQQAALAALAVFRKEDRIVVSCDTSADSAAAAMSA